MRTPRFRPTAWFRVSLWTTTRTTQRFPRIEMFGLTQRMRRAALSVLCNIAEGQGRWSRSDARQFAVIARGSLLELEAQILIASDLQYIEAGRADDLVDKALDVLRMIDGLIRYYDNAQS